MIISKYKKDDILRAVDSYINKLVLGQPGYTLKRFGVIGDIIEYAIFKSLDSIASQNDDIVIIQKEKSPVVTQRELDYFLEEIDVENVPQDTSVSVGVPQLVEL